MFELFTFQTSGVETYLWLPLVVAFVVSSLTSSGGVTGAFLLLPFQVSFLGFTGPAVSPTNLVYNIVCIPGGVYRFWKEKRMVWPLAWATLIGTLPGVFIGAIIRIKYLPQPGAFKLFAGLVLLYLGARLGQDLFRKQGTASPSSDMPEKFEVSNTVFNLKTVAYDFNGIRYQASTPAIMLMSALVGIVGGTYGIGGGAIISPFFVAIFRLPVHTVAGAALLGTFFTSIVGVVFYSLLAPYYADTGLAIAPDWHLGVMFGVGGAAGVYLGARLQRWMPPRVIKAILSACLLFIAVKYILGFFLV